MAVDGFCVNLDEDFALDAKKFKFPEARAVYDAILKNKAFKVRATGTKKVCGELFEIIVADIATDIPQTPKENIQRKEPIELRFSKDANDFPEIYALRKDFPQVPFLKWTPNGEPRSLCVYAEEYSHNQLTWTGKNFLARVQFWFRENSRGNLRQPGQPLEQIFFANTWEIIIPAEPKKETERNEKVLFISTHIKRYNGNTIILDWIKEEELQKLREKNPKAHPSYHIAHLRGQPHHHRIIHQTPSNFKELHDYLQSVKINFSGEIEAIINSNYQKLKSHQLLIFVDLPKTRENSSKIEGTDYWVFKAKDNFETIAEKFDAVILINGEKQTFTLIENPEKPKTENTKWHDIKIEILSPKFNLTPQYSARLNSVPQEMDDKQFVMIGAGSLGSQLLEKFYRMGVGSWSVTDKDHLLPHNISRHLLPHNYVGSYKTDGLKHYLASIFPPETPPAAFHTDFLKVKKDDGLMKIVLNANAIIDVSTSIAVSRKLAIETNCKRAISTFISPSGESSILIAEDSKRVYRLDFLEAQYYRWIIESDEGETHLRNLKEPIRYGKGCREISNLIQHDCVVLHSGILSQQIRRSLNNIDARLCIWKSISDGMVSKFEIKIFKPRKTTSAGWTILYDDGFVETVCNLRSSKLPNETGGVLLGYFDMPRKRIYIVNGLPEPKDSKSSPGSFERGTEGLPKVREETTQRTMEMVDIIGDWHSHPDGVKAQPSPDDKTLLKHNAEIMEKVGCPGIILIVGENHKLNFLVQKY